MAWRKKKDERRKQKENGGSGGKHCNEQAGSLGVRVRGERHQAIRCVARVLGPALQLRLAEALPCVSHAVAEIGAVVREHVDDLNETEQRALYDELKKKFGD